MKARLEKILDYLSHEVNVLEIEKTISTKTQKRFEDQMRKAMLREKKKTIEEELGEIDESELSTDELKEYKTIHHSLWYVFYAQLYNLHEDFNQHST